MIGKIILVIVIFYMIPVFVVSSINFDVNKIEFCKQNGFEEYGHAGAEDFCIKKLFEENKLLVEKKTIYCEPEVWIELLYFQPRTETCYLLKEVV